MIYRIVWEDKDEERYVRKVEASTVDEAIELWEKTAKETDFIVEIWGLLVKF